MLKENQLFPMYRKCEFWLSSLVFLGHIISSEGVEVDPRKIEAVKNWARPLTSTTVRSFSGLVGYYRSFVDCFASITSPLTTLKQNNMKLDWWKACERSFQILKDRLTSAPVLNLSVGAKGFVVYCDASRAVLGSILMQHGKVEAYALGNMRFMRRIIQLVILS